ncbi:hypothetical protein A2799_04570 [Candidatus Roizmanbacteria bacterium RIFCSPHIGHO2_01_FULL_39_24]|uniref:Uncharacterized protein n=1 Tax=Candidatus Roizmanbacteria bacterium RIFCSPHIGHO2_01_FULL_39_24 TaxID=1802032 RepID=A0A1F7GM62_9BACT|nr:MAG: hypothetical protein A2799_04570 [Candidatus Roizmanbacteria bacterium RIFCSPHIGHO2_01_FULL_39_24]OGK49524.1 MAG: hypothetical protein A3A56_03490 [Candidatus Roizmanbacteria bacterium RIFCSPLOWO2_01_FULL_40_32]
MKDNNSINKELLRKLEEVSELLKTLIIVELAKNGTNREQVRKVLDVVDNNRTSKIISAVNFNNTRKGEKNG